MSTVENSSVPTYQQLFGSADYHTVESARSVLSAGAYFAALMTLIKNNIKGPTNILKERRPDLYEIVLDKENTDTLIPKLEIVNQVLEKTLKKKEGDWNTGKLTEAKYPFSLPYNKFLAAIRVYLAQNEVSLAKIWRNLTPAAQLSKEAEKAIALEILGLSPEQWSQYSTPNTTVTDLNPYYGFSPTNVDNHTNVESLIPSTSVDTFLEKTTLDYSQLLTLVYGELSQREIDNKLNQNFFINVDTHHPIKIDAQNETLDNLSIDNLDHIARFVRLAQSINWSFPDLDWALQTIERIVNASKPVINDTALPYLAWMEMLKQQKGLSVNQCCALLYELKDFGNKDGAAFFEQVFANPDNPSVTLLNQEWTVAQSTAINKQIQAALAAALQINQNDLLSIAHVVLTALKITDYSLKLTPQNLAILYRLSLLPTLTDLSVKEALVAAELCSPEPDTFLQYLGGNSASDAKSAINTLMAFTAWQKSSPFSVCGLQFILQGHSDDPAIQNKVLGEDAITNFVNNLCAALEKIRLTEKNLFNALKSDLRHVLPEFMEGTVLSHSVQDSQAILNQIYATLTSTYIDKDGIVLVEPKSHDKQIVNQLMSAFDNFLEVYLLQQSNDKQIVKKLKSTFDKCLPTDIFTQDQLSVETLKSDFHKCLQQNEQDKQVVEKLMSIFDKYLQTHSLFNFLAQTIEATLKNYYQQQQETFIKHLAALYNISAPLAVVLKEWGDLNLTRIIGESSLKTSLLSHFSSAEITQQQISILQKLQRAAQLITDLKLSVSEARYFKIDYHPNSAYPISLATIQTMQRFSQLVHIFQDTQNHLVGVLKETNSEVATQKLAKFTGWNPEQIQFLTDEKVIYTVDKIAWLQSYFSTAKQLGIDVEILHNLVGLSGSTTTDQQENLAQMLWSGLQSQYHDQPEVLSQLQNHLRATLRDKLLVLVMNQYGFTSPREVYAHLLIDVEVSGSVQTTVIKEAITACQLYVYRCLNQLEAVDWVHAELDEVVQLWTWMSSFRDWQANKQVFLYPENYLQPELLEKQTDLFTQAKSSLLQANLHNPDAVTTVFSAYMNDFTDIAGLKIVGSAAHDWIVDEIATKELCLVGMTRRQPHRYYYRIATFVYSTQSKQFLPQTWGSWQKITAQIQPVQYGAETDELGAVTPVFAFGKWYVFWVAQRQTGSSKDTNGDTRKEYTATIQYSHLDFSHGWVAAQILTSIDLQNSPMSTAETASVYPVYFTSIETLYMPYRGKLHPLSENILSNNVVMAYRFVSPTPPTVHNESLEQVYSLNGNSQSCQYYAKSINDKPNNAVACSMWFKIPEGQSEMVLSKTPNVVAKIGHHLIIKDVETTVNPIIKADVWYHIAYSDEFLYFNLNPLPFLIAAYYLETSDSVYTSYNGEKWEQVAADNAPKSSINCFYNFNNVLYVGTGHGLYSYNDGQWEKVTVDNAPQDSTTCFYNFNNVFYVGTRQGLYSYNDGQWEKVTVVNAPHDVSCLYSVNNTLYMGTNHGLYSYNDGQWEQVTVDNAPHDVSCLYSVNNTLYVGTNHGLYSYNDRKWKQVTGDNASRYLINCLYSVNNTLYVGTNRSLYSYNDRKWKQVTGDNAPRDMINCLYSVNDTLYVGAGRGLYSYNDRKWKQVLDNTIVGCLYFNVPTIPSPDKAQESFFQEVLYFNNSLTFEQITTLYENGKNTLTQNFSDSVSLSEAFSTTIPLNSQPTLNQPNWNIINNDKAEYLTIPYQSTDNSTQLNCYRLNSTAAHEVEKYLHQPVGINALLSIDAQQSPEQPFQNLFPNPSDIPTANNPSNQIDFTHKSAMSNYYWEIFFFLPFLIARELNLHQHFKPAKKWLEYIFDPTVSTQKITNNDVFWRFLGLRTDNNPKLKQELNETTLQQEEHDLHSAIQREAYETDPFDPKAIADLRPIVYQKTIVMHYIRNLLDWGDQLYRENTRESIMEAEMFYVLAYNLLGEHPKNLGSDVLPKSTNYTDGAKNSGYFAIPRNQQFLAYWDEVQQRLYNIRHGLTIDGKTDVLPLFQPPINPMAMVAAMGSGESVAQAISQQSTVIPHYRFEVMIEKAKAATHSVIQLGQSLLSALEKKDAEALANLHNTQQQHFLNLTRTSKQTQLKAATQNLNALQAGLEGAQNRLTHYQNLISTGYLPGEKSQITLQKGAIIAQSEAEAIMIAAIVEYLLPDIFGFSDGGMQFGQAANQGANVAQNTGSLLSMQSGLAGTMASYKRREQDWQLQQTLAQDDINQIHYQILTAQYHQALAQQDIDLLEKQIEQAHDIAAFYLKKFTNEQLYRWYVGQLSTLYFQTYQLAHELALQAQNAWQFEHTGNSNADELDNFITGGYWNNLYEGLLSGETLLLNLQRMEKVFTDQNERRLEIDKTLSLAALDPKAFHELKTTGQCTFDLSEKDFAFDFPGHYCRQIKTLSLSLPVVLGPYQNLHATLTQTANRVVTSDDENGQQAVAHLLNPQQALSSSNALKVDVRPNQQIALSQGVNDSGLFTLNFNDTRYLPFEGTGVVSSWQLQMPKEENAFDFNTLTDVIIQLKYTALVGSLEFKKAVQQHRGAFQGKHLVAVSGQADWQAFVNQQSTALNIPFKPQQLRPNMKTYHVAGLTLYAVGADNADLPAMTLNMPIDSGTAIFTFSSWSEAGIAVGSNDKLPIALPAKQENWTLTFAKEDKKLSSLKRLVLSVDFTANA